MPRHKNTEKLHKLMAEHNLSGPDVAALMKRSLKTVHCWRAQSPAPISDTMLELFEFKLAARQEMKLMAGTEQNSGAC